MTRVRLLRVTIRVTVVALMAISVRARARALLGDGHIDEAVPLADRGRSCRVRVIIRGSGL